MRKIISFIILLACLSGGQVANAQNKSNKGREFWLGYGNNLLFTQDPPINSQELVLYLSTELATSVTVSVNSTGWSQTINIPANTVDFSVIIPKSGANDARILNEGLWSRGIHIVSTEPIVAYAHQYGRLSSGATMLMPVETFGYTYYSINYRQTSNFSNCYSWFFVVASENNTRVEITPSDTTVNGWLPNQTYTVNLNKGEIYNVMGKLNGNNFSGKDMTGSKVVSVAGNDGACHPIGMFSGSSRNTLYGPSCDIGNGASGNGGEFMHQQIFPASAWGTRYLTYHNVNNTSGNISTPFLNFYRVAVRNPATIVKRNGVVMTGLINNFYYEFTSTAGDYIEADQPIMVAQYTVSANECSGTNASPLGDPEMIYISPIEQGVKNASFYNTRNQAITLSFVHVFVPTSALPSLRIDGAALSAAEILTHPANPTYSIAVKRLLGAAAQHNVTCDSAFVATVYGIGTLESYGYNVGTFVNNLNAQSEIKNTYNTTGLTDTFTCPKSPVRLFVKLAYPATNIHWKLTQVAGMNPNTADSIINNPVPIRTETINNRNYYVYTLNEDFYFATTGTYTIPVSYTAPEIDACNNTENTVVTVLVKPGPVSDFNFNNPACVTDSIRFTGTPTANGFNLVNYNWLFDDNTTASTINTVKRFITPGNHDVRFRVYADNGCLGDTTKTINLAVSPIAMFNVNPTDCAGDSLLITDASTTAAGNITSWQWNFGDGNSQVRTNNLPFKYRFISSGNYVISLITTSSNGCKSDTAFIPVTILPKPVANFTYNNNICTGDSILFTDNSSSTSGAITSWNWDFGDGNSQVRINNAAFYHPYTIAGNFPVSLVVNSSNGCNSDTFRLTVIVTAKPTAAFTVNGKPCVDSLYNFASTITSGSGNSPNWYWDFGDGNIFNSAANNIATHAYSVPINNISVKHWVQFSGGCNSDTATSVIALINPNPVISFLLSPGPYCAKTPILIASTATGINSWNWNFGNGNGNSSPSFTRTYNNAGTYTITASGKSAEGCGSLPVSQVITINPIPAIDAGPDKYIRFGTSTTLDAVINNPPAYDFIWTPSFSLDNGNILNPVATPSTPTVYTIQAIDKVSGCFNKDSVLITPVSDIFVPTAFTPNNDGKNDYWVIPGLALYPDAIVTIFNRWGQIVHKTKNYVSNPWNGVYRTVKQPADAYVYVINIPGDEPQLLKGTFLLIW